MLMHSAINNWKDIVPSGAAVPPGVFSPNAPLMGWLVLGLLWMAAAYFLIRMPATLDAPAADPVHPLNVVPRRVLP
jgi:hypothetical protein